MRDSNASRSSALRGTWIEVCHLNSELTVYMMGYPVTLNMKYSEISIFISCISLVSYLKKSEDSTIYL